MVKILQRKSNLLLQSPLQVYFHLNISFTNMLPITLYTGPVKFPQTTEDFDWTNILENKSARDYQVQCFVEALQRDLVAVLPTGAGKTLIASMLLKRMKELNPEKMGLFIVDRIPLVYQQTNVGHQHKITRNSLNALHRLLNQMLA